jgi:RNA polymerase sigma-70 factor (ECF subfamily)
MDTDEIDHRLSRITTLWTLHVRAHSSDAASAGRAELLFRYRAAAYRYILAAVRNADAADDLSQDFAVRFLRGDFRHADPGRGRFRDYLRTALPASLAADPAAAGEDADTTFQTAWREELLERTWQRLAVEQPTGHAALRLRVEESELTSAQMAERLSATLGRVQTSEGVRKALQRAHDRFAEVLLDEIAATLESPTAADLEAELQELGLTRYCRTALARRRQ